jgi:hypothetical protein
MKQALVLLSIISGLYSCNNKSAGNGSNNTPPDGCYIWTSDNRDTVSLRLESNGANVTGKLMYGYFAKDKNTGTLQGKMSGDTLWAQYTFTSEGRRSTRAVVFLRKGETFTEGYGKLNEATGEPDLSDKTAIHFDGKTILKKTDCTDLK